MSVLACGRSGCGSVMCDDYSNIHGYICPDCKDELKIVFPDISVSSFMETEPGTFINHDFAGHVDDIFSD